jgi:hypothetical protein
LALATVWPPAVGIVILGLLTNMTLRYVHAPRLGPLLRPFRQLGPLLATATALQPMVTGDLSPLGPTLTDDVSSQQRLRRMVRWVSHDPMLSDDFTNGLFEAANLMLLLDVSVLYFAAKEVRAHGPALLRTIATLGTVDAAISIASYRAGTSGWIRPVLESSAQLAEGLAASATGRSGPELAYARGTCRRAGDGVKHVRQVDLFAHSWRERGAGPNAQHLPGVRVRGAGLHDSQRDREG